MLSTSIDSNSASSFSATKGLNISIMPYMLIQVASISNGFRLPRVAVDAMLTTSALAVVVLVLSSVVLSVLLVPQAANTPVAETAAVACKKLRREIFFILYFLLGVCTWRWFCAVRDAPPWIFLVSSCFIVPTHTLPSILRGVCSFFAVCQHSFRKRMSVKYGCKNGQIIPV